MFKNYLKIALRNLRKSKAYALINISGLALGMAAALLIGLWIWDEVTYNRSIANYRDIVQVLHNQTHGDEINTRSSNAYPLASALRTNYAADFKYVALSSQQRSRLMGVGDKQVMTKGYFAEPDLPHILSLSMQYGNVNALTDPSSVLISSSLATSLFGHEPALNKTIKVDNRHLAKVAGVFNDFARNSSFSDVQYMMAYAFLRSTGEEDDMSQEWNSNSYNIFAQLQPGRDAQQVSSKVKHLLEGHGRRDKPEVLLHPMSKWHLYSDFKNGKNNGGAIQFVWMFGVVGLFILLLACINFMNLSTARSEKRAKEVGIRKAVGSLRGQLVAQFLSESVLLAGIAMLLALLIAALALPWFNSIAQKQMALPWQNPVFWLLLAGFTLLTGLLAGSYPAFFLSSFQPVKVLKGSMLQAKNGAIPRKVLVVLQFTVSASLIIATLVVYQQITYVRNRPVGYSRADLINVPINVEEYTGHFDAIRNDLLHSGGVLNMAVSSSPTTGVWSHQTGFNWPGKDPSQNLSFGVVGISHEFGKTIGWQFVDGRDFSRDFASDSAAFILNEAAAKLIGMKDPVNKTIEYLYSSYPDKNYRIIGVVKNMVMESPFDDAKPVIFALNYEWTNVFNIKLNTAAGTKAALDKVAAVFKKYSPATPFEYSFVDSDYATKFAAEERISSLATLFTGFAIFISCLGLFGLASFTAEQRTKEIGVRKVLGASVLNVWSLLSKDFLALILVSFFIAVPVSYYCMHRWLQQYDYRTTISVWIFLITIGAVVFLTIATVSMQALRAAYANPVKSLRSE
ncbi:ABC transporter permease [Deminuibacter soli]|uniref:ABC transporter permease n=1 Tax=Deminuibacter soli TaxID=2291815 RepID=A0A3E1NJY2_9BACT|nr:ABC transporter permease [Deminuibacter soli]RFM28246.1 ABC transporter permease [Deminuibacter soli]